MVKRIDENQVKLLDVLDKNNEELSVLNRKFREIEQTNRELIKKIF